MDRQSRSLTLVQQQQLTELGRGKHNVAPATEHLRTLWKILVVENEESLLNIACEWLEGFGFEVCGVVSTSEALEGLSVNTFDILFSDVMMPSDLNGVEIANRPRKLQPNIRVLQTSGYTPIGISDKKPLPAPLLTKPYRKEKLREALECLLNTTL